MPAAPADVSWVIRQGRTFRYRIRPETATLVYKPITAIAKSAPVSITATGHGLVTGWSAAVTNVGGMTELNATANKLKATDFRQVTVVDLNTVTINAIDSSGFSPYTSGGHLVYYMPVAMFGAKVRLDLRDKVGGTLLYRMSDTLGNIAIDNTNHMITVTIPATASAAFAFTAAVGDLEIEYTDGTVEELLHIDAEVHREITTSP